MNSRMSIKSLLTFTLALLMVVGCVAGLTSIKASAAEVTAKLDLSNKGNRTVFKTTQQVWEQNGITLTNDKASSTSNVADYAPPRLYANSKVTISAPGNITKIVVVCSESKYATALVNSAKSNATATASSSTVTITPNEASSTYVIAKLTAQVRCGASITVTYEAGCSHVEKDEVTKPATCTETGLKNVVCSECGETLETNVEIPVIPHPDADGNGQCDVCGDCSHKSTTPVEDVPPTCTEPGWAGKTICDACGEVANPGEAVPQTGHLKTEDNVTQAPTCTEPGKMDKVCVECGVPVQSDLPIAATGHNIVDGECQNCHIQILAIFDFGENGAATHTDGSALSSPKTYTYGDVSLVLTDLSRVYGSARDAKGNSCLKLGTGDYTASLTFTVGDDVEKVIIYISGYKAKKASIVVNGTTYAIDTTSDTGEYTAIEIDTSVTKTITLTTNSSPDKRAMINTIEFYPGESSEPAGCEHVWGDWETVTDATIFKNGTQERHCGLCDDVQTQDIPAIADVELTIPQANELGGSKEHNSYTEGKYYVVGKIVELYGKDSDLTYGNFYIEDEAGNRILIYGLYTEGGVRYDAMEVKPVIGDTIKVYGVVGRYNENVQVKSATLIEHTPAVVEPEASITEVVVNVSDNLAVKYLVSANSSAVEAGMTLEVTFNGGTVVLTPVEVEGQLMFVFEGVAPQLMGKNISVVFKVGGEVKAEKAEWSVREDLLKMVDDETYGALVKALLAYGDAAQTYMGVEGELSGVEVDMEQPGQSEDAKLSNNTLTNHGIVSATVEFDSTVKLVFTVYLGTTEGVEVKLGGVACEVTPVEGKDGYYTVSTAAISAVEMCQGFKLTIEGAGDVTPTLEYSINSYAYRILKNEDASDAMKALAAALYYYSKCAQDL